MIGRNKWTLCNDLDCLMMLIVFLPFLFFCVVSVFGRATPCLLPSLSPCVSHVFLPLVCPPIPMSCLVFPTCVCGGCHTPTLCPAVLLPLQSSLSVSLFHHHHPSSPLVCVKRVCVRNGEEDQQTCVIQKACGKRGAKRETEDHMWCQHLVTNPGPNHTHTPFTSLFSPQVLFPSCCGSRSFSAAPFGVMTRGEWFVCCQTSTQKWHTFSCANPLSNHLFLLVTSPHSCPCGVVMSVCAHSMQPMRPSEVSAIITSLWCLVFVVWCPQSPLLYPFTHSNIHWLCHV